MAEQDIRELFLSLYSDISEANEFYNEKPLLAHYTSIEALEGILKNDTVWFSNPLFMNDFQEVRFGVNEALRLFLSSSEVEGAAETSERHLLLKNSFDNYYNQFAEKHAIDTYVFSLSKHDPENDDGRLSMWRGYGANGNGACLVFDSGKVPALQGSPLVFAKVHYATGQARVDQISKYILDFCEILKANEIPNDKLGLAVYFLFERIKLFALFTKHCGFSEEQEWRIVYLPDRDTKKSLTPMIDYLISARGIEPKLKYKFSHLVEETGSQISLSTIIDRIILGPTTSTPLAKAMIEKMLDKINRPELKSKLRASTIPFR
jgi:Protein of unknown function (DUF2971)